MFCYVGPPRLVGVKCLLLELQSRQSEPMDVPEPRDVPEWGRIERAEVQRHWGREDGEGRPEEHRDSTRCESGRSRDTGNGGDRETTAYEQIIQD